MVNCSNYDQYQLIVKFTKLLIFNFGKILVKLEFHQENSHGRGQVLTQRQVRRKSAYLLFDVDSIVELKDKPSVIDIRRLDDAAYKVNDETASNLVYIRRKGSLVNCEFHAKFGA